MTTIDAFVKRYNANEKLQKADLNSIKNLEDTYNINLPNAYKYLLINYGDIWTPNLLDIVVDNNLDLNEISEFWTIENIVYDKTNEWTSNLDEDVIPFASDSMGNIFCFKTVDLNSNSNNAKIYMFDHDFETVDYVAENFVEFIDAYLKINN